MSLFIVDGYNWGYGESEYFCVEADTKKEAESKVKYKLSLMSEEDKRKADILPCEVLFDEFGVSQQLGHQW